MPLLAVKCNSKWCTEKRDALHNNSSSNRTSTSVGWRLEKIIVFFLLSTTTTTTVDDEMSRVSHARNLHHFQMRGRCVTGMWVLQPSAAGCCCWLMTFQMKRKKGIGKRWLLAAVDC